MPDPTLWPALALAAFGAFLDFKERRLPNWLCAVLALAASSGLALSEGVELLPWALLHATIAIAIGMALFALGVIGGGDAKFYAAVALAVPATSIAGPMALLGWTSVAGLLLLVGMMVWRRTRKRPATQGLLKGWAVPYGFAIACGFYLTLFLG
jgi:prepilin peptidase CpaA